MRAFITLMSVDYEAKNDCSERADRSYIPHGSFYSLILRGIFLSGIGDEAITDSANGKQIAWLRGLGLDIAPEPDDKIVDGSRIRVFVQVPDFLQQLLARDGFPVVLNEAAKQIGFHHRQGCGLIACTQLQIAKVHRLIVELKNLLRRRGRLR